MNSNLKTVVLLMIGTATATTAALAAEPIQPIKPVQNINLAQVELGKKLYSQNFDRRPAQLSAAGSAALDRCHSAA